MPDINGAVRDIEFWLELKVCKNKKYGTAGLWRPMQVSWQMSRSKKIRNVWNVVSHPNTDTVYVYRCEKVMALSNGVETVPDLVMYGPVNWMDLVELVRSNFQKGADIDLGVRDHVGGR